MSRIPPEEAADILTLGGLAAQCAAESRPVTRTIVGEFGAEALEPELYGPLLQTEALELLAARVQAAR